MKIQKYLFHLDAGHTGKYWNKDEVAGYYESEDRNPASFFAMI